MEVEYEVYDGVIVIIEQEPVSKEIIEVPAFDDSPHVIEVLAGEPGVPNTLTIDEVAASEPGGPAGAEITGAAPAQKLSLVIPRGEVGPRGPIGPVNVLTAGPVITASPSAEAAVEITGAAPDQTISFTIPRGARWHTVSSVPTAGLGLQGDWAYYANAHEVYEKTTATAWTSRGNIKGATGDTGPVNVLSVGDVSASTPGSNPIIEITGSAPSQEINFTIPRGQTGPPNTLSIGAVETGNPGTNASATISGTAPSQSISLVIPRGSVGPTGPSNVLSIGSVETTAPGTQASVEINGESPSQTLHLTFPRGDTGAQGPVNTLTVGEVVTGAPGTNVIVDIEGTSPNQVLNLTIPQGLPGQGNVDSVNGLPGPNIILTAADVGALSAAEVNDMFTDASAYLRNRDNHIGTQTISTVSGLQAALDSKSASGHTHTSSAITDFNSAVDSRISLIISDAPETLDTLSELAAALGNDPNFATTMTNLIGTKADIGHGHSLTDSNITGILPVAQVPNLDTAKVTTGTFALARLPVATSGASNATQLVRADDTRLSNARTPTNHSHTITDLPVATSGTSNTTQLVRADDVRLSNARTPTAHGHTITDVANLQTELESKAASTHGHALTDVNITGVLPLAQMPTHSHTKSQITDFAHSHGIGDLPVAPSGTSNATQLVRADDARLSNARTPVAHGHALTDANITGVLPQAQMVPNVQRFLFTTAGTARPTGSTYVEWVGPVRPDNLAEGDSWVEVS